jgi:type I restriction-modification system DNA methylase subunit/restriction endonuclease S subunit
MFKKNNINQLFNKLKDVLRHSEDHVTGRDAVLDISQLITLKKLEDTNRIQYFDLPDYCKFSSISNAIDEYEKKGILMLISIYCDTETNLLHINKGIFIELTNNKYTGHAFTTYPHYRKLNTFIELIKEIQKFGSIIESEQDDLGSQYEILLRTLLVGRDDGQYFTNRNTIKLIVNEIKPILGETIYDPTCGTGGFLIYSMLYLKSQIKTKEDLKILSENTLYGCDIDSNVIQLLHCNLLLNEIKHNDNFKCFNTVTENMLYDKYDIILSNFPFGRKGTDIFKTKDKELIKYYGFKTRILPILLLKHTMNILKNNGRGGIIVTLGELYNNGSVYHSIRKELIERNKLTKIMILPKRLFDNAPNVSTVVLFFTKGSKTDSVEFIEITDVTCTKRKSLRIITYDQIVNNNYVLDPNVYSQPVNNSDIITMKLDDICEINYGQRIVKELDLDLDLDQKYPVYGGGDITFYTNKFNRDGKTLIVSRFGMTQNCVRIINGKFWLNDSGMSLHPKTNIDSEYLNIMMIFFMNEIYKCGHGSIQKSINLNKFKQIRIPVPAIEIQKQIAEYISNQNIILTDLINYFNKINLVKMLLNCQFVKFDYVNKVYLAILNTVRQIESEKIFIKLIIDSISSDTKPLRDVCQIKTGMYISKNNLVRGKYNIYGGGDSSGMINKYNRKDKLVIAKDGVSSKCVRYVSGKFFLNHHGWTLSIIDFRINEDFLNYFLLYSQEKIYDLAKGILQKGINQDNFYDKIHIPIIEPYNQDIIVKQILLKENIIKSLQMSIVGAKKNIHIVLQDYLKQNLE